MSDDQAWKNLSEKYAYRRMSSDSITLSMNNVPGPSNQGLYSTHQHPTSSAHAIDSMDAINENAENATSSSTSAFAKGVNWRNKRLRPKSTHRSHFKHRYLVESAWKKGGHMNAKHITPDQGVVTSLHLTKKYIIVALDNARIHIFGAKGDHQRTLHGHIMGVWAMVPWDDILVSGGCDRDVRVWDMSTG